MRIERTKWKDNHKMNGNQLKIFIHSLIHSVDSDDYEMIKAIR